MAVTVLNSSASSELLWKIRNSSEDEFLVMPDLPGWVFLASSVYFVLVSVAGFTLNLSIFLLWLRTKELWTDYHLLLMNLITTELTIAAVALPLNATATWRGGWNLGREACLATGFLCTFLGMNSMSSLTTIAVFRWILTTEKTLGIFPSNRRMVQALIAFTWGFSLLLSLPPLLGWGEYRPEPNGFICSPHWASLDPGYNIYLFSVGFFLPLCIVIISSCRVISNVNNNTRGLVSSDIRHKAIKKQTQVLRMVVVLVAVFVVCWTPYALMGIAGILGFSEIFPLSSTVLPHLMAKFAIIFHPIIFILMNKKFQSFFRLSCLTAQNYHEQRTRPLTTQEDISMKTIDKIRNRTYPLETPL